jgi:hypothetical protein
MIDPQSWRKSSYSGSQKECVEVGTGPATVGVRDTKNRDTGHLAISRAAWAAFVHSVAR